MGKGPARCTRREAVRKTEYASAKSPSSRNTPGLEALQDEAKELWIEGLTQAGVLPRDGTRLRGVTAVCSRPGAFITAWRHVALASRPAGRGAETASVGYRPLSRASVTGRPT